MKCKKCGSEWKTDASRSASLTLFPFCQEKIVSPTCNSEWKIFDNTRELLLHIATEYENGQEILLDKRMLSAYLSDHAAPSLPQKQKSVVKQAIECGAVKVLADNINSDQAHREIAVKIAVRKMDDRFGTAQDVAERIIWEFTNALGWQLPTPQSHSYTETDAESLIQLAHMFLFNADWQEAEYYFKKALEQMPNHAAAWIGLLCVDLKTPEESKLTEMGDPHALADHRHYKTAMQCADTSTKARLNGYIQKMNEKIAAAEGERRAVVKADYDDVCKDFDIAKTPDDYRSLITAFKSINSDYQDISNDIKTKIADCEQLIKEAEQQ